MQRRTICEIPYSMEMRRVDLPPLNPRWNSTLYRCFLWLSPGSSAGSMHFLIFISQAVYMVLILSSYVQIVDVIDQSHPSTRMLPVQWEVLDEMYWDFTIQSKCYHLILFRYNFKSDPRALGAIVLLAANETSYTGSYSIFLVILLHMSNETSIQIRVLAHITKEYHTQ